MEKVRKIGGQLFQMSRLGNESAHKKSFIVLIFALARSFEKEDPSVDPMKFF